VRPSQCKIATSHLSPLPPIGVGRAGTAIEVRHTRHPSFTFVNVTIPRVLPSDLQTGRWFVLHALEQSVPADADRCSACPMEVGNPDVSRLPRGRAFPSRSLDPSAVSRAGVVNLFGYLPFHHPSQNIVVSRASLCCLRQQPDIPFCFSIFRRQESP
jgi:hypothetical protein